MGAKKYKMNPKQAEETLQNVFSACNIKQYIQANEIEHMSQKHHNEALSFRIMMGSVLLILILILVAPFAFTKSPVKISEMPETTTLQMYEHHVENGIFYLTFTGGEVDYSSVKILKSDGSEVSLQDFNPGTSTIIFPYTGEELNIYVSDMDGGQLHMLLSPKKKN